MKWDLVFFTTIVTYSCNSRFCYTASNNSCGGGGLGIRLCVWHICLGPTNKPSGNSAALRLSPRVSRASFRASLVTGFVELLSHSRTTLRRHTWALPSSPVKRAPIVSNSPIGTSSSIPNSFHFDATGIKSFVKQSSPGCSMQKRYWGVRLSCQTMKIRLKVSLHYISTCIVLWLDCSLRTSLRFVVLHALMPSYKVTTSAVFKLWLHRQLGNERRWDCGPFFPKCILKLYTYQQTANFPTLQSLRSPFYCLLVSSVYA